MASKKRAGKDAGKSQGIGAFAMGLMRHTTKTNEEILQAVWKQYPDAKTKYASIAWYRSKIRREAAESKARRQAKKVA